jgi:Protein of unknown function (DUF2975)
MKKQFISFFSSTPFLVFIGLFVFWTMAFCDPFGTKKTRTDPKWERRNYILGYYLQALKPADTILYKYGVKKRDSIEQLFSYQDELNYFKKDYYASSFRFSIYNLYKPEECFRCNEIGPDDSYVSQNAAKAIYYYIGLKGFELKDNRHYFRDNNTDYIINELYNSSSQEDGHPKEKIDPLLKRFRFANYLDQEASENIRSVPFRYDYWNQVVLIPLSKKSYSLFFTLLRVIGIASWIYAWLLLFFVPFRILRNVSLGKTFDIGTIKRVDFLAYNFLLYPFIVFIYRSAVHLFVRKYITADLRSTALTELFGSGLLLYIGFLLFVLGVALKKGYKLQQEQELTV